MVRSLPLTREGKRYAVAYVAQGESREKAALEERKMKQYNQSNIPLAKQLRKNMTPWERKLWYLFLRTYPVRFQRQKVIGNYIVDFYCAQAGLALELDGGGHYEPEQAEKDRRRTADLESMGLRVLRLCNTDIDRQFREVCTYIDMAVKETFYV